MGSLATAASEDSFAARVRSAVYWRWGSQVLAQAITWSTTILVVRLLVPGDYGLFAMTQAVVTALNFLSGYSFATSLIQSDDVGPRRVGQVFGLLIVSNLLLAAAQVMLAPLAAAYYGQPVIADLLMVQALLFLTTPFIALPASLLARALDFRRQALVNLASALAGALTALGLALAGMGVWALVWAPIALFATRAAGLTLAAGGLVRPVFDFRGARDIIGFGSALTLCQLFWILQSQADIVIAGRAFSPHALGIYSEALFLVLIFNGRFLPPLNEVAYPAYAELHHAGRPIGPAFLDAVQMIMLLAVPFHIGLALVAGPLVETFFGAKWLEMVPVVSGLALAMPAMALQIACAPATNALGRTGCYVATAGAGAVIMPAAFLLGVAQGAPGLVRAWQVAAPLLLLVTLGLTLRALRIRWLELCGALAPSLGSATIMAAVLLATTPLLADWAAPARLLALTTLGAAAYLAGLAIIARDTLRQVIRLVSNRQFRTV